MCYEYEELARSEEARRREEERRRKEQESAPGTKPGEKAPQQPEPVPA